MSQFNTSQIPAGPRAIPTGPRAMQPAREHQPPRRRSHSPHGAALAPWNTYSSRHTADVPGLSGPQPVPSPGAPSRPLITQPPPPGLPPMHHATPGPYRAPACNVPHQPISNVSLPFGFDAGQGGQLAPHAFAQSPSGEPLGPYASAPLLSASSPACRVISPFELDTSGDQLLLGSLNPAANVWFPIPVSNPAGPFSQQMDQVMFAEPETRAECAQLLREATDQAKLRRAYQIEDPRESNDAVNEWFWEQCILGDKRRREEEEKKREEEEEKKWEEANNGYQQARQKRSNITADAR